MRVLRFLEPGFRPSCLWQTVGPGAQGCGRNLGYRIGAWAIIH